MRHSYNPAFFSLVLASHTLAACSAANVTGKVDGDTVPAFSTGLVFEANALTDDDDTVAVAAFYSFTNGCALIAQQMDVKADGLKGLGDGKSAEKMIDSVNAFEEANMPDDYWAAYAIVAGENQSDIADDFEIGEDSAAVLLCHHTGGVDAPRDQPQAALLPDFMAAFFKDSNRDCYLADEGDVLVSGYDRKSISLAAVVELKDGDDDDAGEIELVGEATHCAATENAVDSLLEELDDLSGPAAPPPSSGGDNSCQFAFDGECDEPDGTGICDFGTDTADC